MTRSFSLTLALSLSLMASSSLAGTNAQTIVKPLATTGIPNLTMSILAIQAGRLVIAGTTAAAGVRVRIAGTSFYATANAKRQFAFNLDYRTPDCRFTLQSPTGTLDVMIGNCGPWGVIARGAWATGIAYSSNDVTHYGGAAWRALRENVNKRPDLNGSDWQIFVARGAAGSAGPQGAQGPAGPQGVPGPQGLHGSAGAQGPAGTAGETGPQGPAGPAGVTPRGSWATATPYSANDLVLSEGSTWRALRANTDKEPSTSPSDWDIFAAAGAEGAAGPAGPAGPTGPAGANGAQGLAGPSGPSGPAGAQGPAGPAGPQGLQGLPGSGNVAVRNVECGGQDCSASCEAGELVMSATIWTTAGGESVFSEEPSNRADGSGWDGQSALGDHTFQSVRLFCIVP